MDLIAYALAKKNSGDGGGSSTPVQPIIPTIGDNGNWFIKGVDTGFRAVAQENVEVDGILEADTVNQNIKVVKDGQETIVGEYTTGIELGNISKLFE